MFEGFAFMNISFQPINFVQRPPRSGIGNVIKHFKHFKHFKLFKLFKLFKHFKLFQYPAACPSFLDSEAPK